MLNWDETLLYPIGKGEGGHNIGSVVGVINAATMTTPRQLVRQLPINLGGSASSIDHGILHPDPKVNELWISNMNGWETIVLDLNTHKVKAYIPTPNGGDTHNGAFVRHSADWKGELLADMGGPKAAVRTVMRERVAAVQPASPAQAAAPAPTPAALGRAIFEKTAGGVGCAACHGMVVYVGLAQSALYGALVLFLFSLGMGIPLVLAALAMARALPLVVKLESAVPWMGLASAVLMASFGLLLLSGNYMMVSEWTFRIVSGTASLAPPAGGPALAAAVAGAGCLAWLILRLRTARPTAGTV